VQISQPRSAAETDDLVFDISCKQLNALTKSGTRSVKLLMYQTGLDTAVVGFYRAVTHYLLRPHAARLAVIPKYFEEAKKPMPSKTWDSRQTANINKGIRLANQSPAQPAEGFADPVAAYGAGKVWMTSRGGNM
jgi:hypothetical protein